MGVALHGNLKDFGIAEVFQLIGQQRKTGLLEIAGDSHKVQLAFDEGAVVWASPVGDSEFAVLGDRLVRCGLITRQKLDGLVRESEASARSLTSLLVSSDSVAESDLDEINGLLSRETIFDVMRWPGGSFHFSAQAVHHDTPPEKLLAAEQILMDGLRMVDEWQTFSELVPSDETVFQRVGQLEVHREKQGMDPETAAQADRIFQLVDGRLTARRIIDLSRLGTFEATRILADLHRNRVIGPLDASALRSVKRKRRPARPIGKIARFAVAAAFPIALLVGIVQFGLQQSPISSDLVGAPMGRHPLVEVRDQFERRRIASSLEVMRLVDGEWPEDLETAAARASEHDLALAPPASRPYYYAKQEKGFLLLVPKR
jgi:hypothetical protein